MTEHLFGKRALLGANGYVKGFKNFVFAVQESAIGVHTK